MRNIILLASQIIETNAKAYFAYEFSKITKYNPKINISDFYLNRSNYILTAIKHKDYTSLLALKEKNEDIFNNIINKMSAQTKNQSPYELSLQHKVFTIWSCSSFCGIHIYPFKKSFEQTAILSYTIPCSYFL